MSPPFCEARPVRGRGLLLPFFPSVNSFKKARDDWIKTNSNDSTGNASVLILRSQNPHVKVGTLVPFFASVYWKRAEGEE